MELKKLGTLVTATTLSFGLLATPALADAMNVNDKPRQLEVLVASTETNVTKSDLIQKFKSIFPNKYDFLTEDDFNMSRGHHYPDDGTIRYDLHFFKELSGKRYISGNIVFAGENLEIEQLYLDPMDVKDALFPGKVSKEEAKNIAIKFIEQFTASKNYQLTDEDSNYYYGMNQPLTEPIRYSFVFERTENGVAVPDQRIDISVLANGDIVSLYRSPYVKATFDSVTNIKSKEEILEQIKQNLSVELQYQVDWDYQTGERTAQLIYAPSIQQGVSASSGKWLVGDTFQTKAPEFKKVEMLSKNPLPPRQEGMTVEQVKAFAEELLKINSNKVTLTIDSIEETVDYYGNEVFYVYYSYNYERGGYGSSLAIDKKTGEFIHFHNVKPDVLKEIGETPRNQRKVSEEQALKKAIEYLKEYAPSKLHQYSKPIQESAEDWYYNGHVFIFPRVVNGVTVHGDQIQVIINENGELNSLYTDYFDNGNWPQLTNAISEEEALNKVLESLSVDLNYVRPTEDPHYALIYSPKYNNGVYSYLDAISGEWKVPEYMQTPNTDEEPKVTHPTAEKELNYFIENGYLEIADFDNFDPDSPITKGEVLKGLVKSLTYFYDDIYYTRDESMENPTQTYDNIGPDHPYYNVIEQAVSMGILDPKNQGFDPDTTITREQLAVWYVRALGLGEAAKHADIFKINVEDANAVNPNYVGYVTLANTFGLLPAEDGKFNPKHKVTYADFVTSAVLLAYKAKEMNVLY